MNPDVYISDSDWNLGKVLKYQKPNPVGEDAYLEPDGTVVFDEAKIVAAQRIFKHNYYKPDGPGGKKIVSRLNQMADNFVPK